MLALTGLAVVLGGAELIEIAPSAVSAGRANAHVPVPAAAFRACVSAIVFPRIVALHGMMSQDNGVDLPEIGVAIDIGLGENISFRIPCIPLRYRRRRP